MKTQKETETPHSGGAILDRMLVAYGEQSVPALAASLGEKASTVKNWRYRGNVPLVHLVRTAQDTKRSLDWLVLGLDAAQASQTEANPYAVMTGAHGSVQLMDAAPHGDAWRNHPEERDPFGGTVLHTGEARERGETARGAGALLPAGAASEVRPLVMSVSLKGAGKRLDYEVIPKVCGGALAGAGLGGQAGRPSRGDGAASMVLDRAGDLAMTYEWLRRNLHHTSGDLATVQVIGDSMSPTLLDGDTVIIDCGARELSVDAIYVVHMLGQRLVKRLQRKFDGSVTIISDNAAYERETVPRGRVGEIEVVGRMVWPRVR